MKSFQIFPYIFPFRKPSGTSRGVMTEKKSWFILLQEDEKKGWGECSIIEGLSPDYQDEVQYFEQIQSVLKLWQNESLALEQIRAFPSIVFGLEMALLDLNSWGNQRLFDTAFTRGEEKIRINGLIWMGSQESMRAQIREKLDLGFRCIKLKIGAIDWHEEHAMLRELRTAFPASEIEIRVDANGAFSAQDAPQILEQLAALDVHSIEQPIRAGQWDAMAQLCENTPCPIALDEELIPIFSLDEQLNLLEHIRPQYIILKPSLHGGISGSQSWIEKAEQLNIPWWMTSALESNLGLNAVAQLASTYDLQLPQGLGTGSLYTTNIPSPLYLEGEMLGFNERGTFELNFGR